jgi:diguanylate cyclase (GGDEF)-like protein
MVDMDRRLRPIRVRTFAMLAVALLAAAPWVGLWTLAPLVLAGIGFWVAERHIEASERPERWAFGAWVSAEVLIAVSVAMTGDDAISLLAILAVPIVTLSARFSARGVTIGVLITVALILAVAFGTGADAALESPPRLIAPLTLTIAIAMLSIALMRSDAEHRNKAVLDQLTDLLNRTALESRSVELEQQSATSGEPVAVILTDLDGFKQVNDQLGHDPGDRALQEVAYVIRRALPAFALIYRLGGDEFLVLLPGSSLVEAEEVATTLMKAVAEADFSSGVKMTVSCGVSASAAGEAFEFTAAYRSADAAVYEAKARGGNAVCCCEGGGRAPDSGVTLGVSTA